MPIFEVTSPDGRVIEVTAPEGATEEQAIAYAQQQMANLPKATPATQGFLPAFKANLTRIGGEMELTKAKMGLTSPEQAEAAYRKAEGEAAAKFTPTEQGWTEAPWQKFKETAGGSAAYMLAPIAGGLAGTFVGGPAGTAVGAGLGTLASLGQFTGTNLAAQLETGKSLEEASGAAAVGAAIPQALLDTLSLRMLPGIGRMFGAAGKEITEESAKAIAQQGIRKAAADYALATGKAMPIEAATEVGQQVLERLQAGLSLTDPKAQADYLENAIGGAALTAVLGPLGRMHERSQIVAEGQKLEQTRLAKERAEAEAKAAEEASKPKPPEPPATYESLILEREALRQGEKTPESKARLAELDDQIKQMTLQQAIEALQMGELKGRRVPSDTGAGPAAESATAFETPDQMEIRAATVEQPVTPELDLFGKPVTPSVPAAEVAPATGEELETAGQQRLDLPEMISPPITQEEVTQFGAVMSKANRAWMQQNVLGKSPEQVRAEFGSQIDTLPKGVVKAVKEIIQNAIPLEATNAPVTAQPTVQPPTKRGRAKPSVVAPVEPAGGPSAGPERRAGEPAGAQPSGLVTAGAPAVAGAGQPAQVVSALTPEAATTRLQEINSTIAANDTALEGILESQRSLRQRSGKPPIPNSPARKQWDALEAQRVAKEQENAALTQEANTLRTVPEAAAAETAALQAERGKVAEAMAGAERAHAMGADVLTAPAAPVQPAKAEAPAAPQQTPEELAIQRVGRALEEEVIDQREHDIMVKYIKGGQMFQALKAMNKRAMERAGKRFQVAETGPKNAVPLTPEATESLKAGDIRSALHDISETSKSASNRAIANRLKVLLKGTLVKADEPLTDPDGNVAYGAASQDGTSIYLHNEFGMNEETVLHESVHAATERVLTQKEDTLTEQQRVAKRELTSLWDAAKRNPEIKLSSYARESLSEFVTEALTNPDLEAQLKKQPWKSQNAWHWFKKHLLQLLGITDPKTMHDSAIAAMDTIFSRPEKITEATHEVKPEGTKAYQLSRETQAMIDRQDAIIQAAMKQGVNTILGTAQGGRINDAITMLRTKITDSTATVSGRLAVKFNNAMRDSTGKLNPIVRVKQALDITKMLGSYIEKGAMDQTKDGTWFITQKEGIPPFTECLDLVDAWGKDNGLTPEKAKVAAARILEAHRLYNLRREAPEAPRHMTDAEIDAAMKDYRADPRMAQMNAIMDKGRNNLVDQMVRVGRLTPEQGKAYKEVVGYVPFDREELNTKMLDRVQKKVGSRGVAQRGQLPTYIGSETRPVKNVFDNYITTVSWMMKEIAHQDASLATLREMEKMGLAKFYKGNVKPNGTNNIVHTFINGEDWTVEVPSAYDVLAFNVRTTPASTLVKAMSNVTSVLRTSVTAFPLFSVKQVAEDTQRAIMHSGVKNIPLLTKLIAQNYAILTKDALTGRQSKIIDEMGNIGLNGGSDYSFTDPAGMVMRQLGREKFKLMGSTKLGELLHRLEGIAHASDLAVRKAIYDASLLETGDKALAQHRAREIINFRTRGASQSLDYFLATIPFFNAYLQGLDVTYRSMTGKDAVSGMGAQQARKMFWQKAGFAFSMAAMLALVRTEDGDDEYFNMDQRKRDNSWILGDGLALPVPTELGALIKVPAERMVEYYRRYGTPEEQSALEAIRTWVTYAGDQTILRANLVPLAVRPIAEILTNHSFVTGRELIGPHQEKILASEQEQPRTSEFAKSVAKFVAGNTGVQVSPIHIDNVLNGYLGTSWAATSMALDAMINPNRVDRPLDRYVGLSAFTYPPVNTQRINEFYDLAKKTNMATATLNQLIERDPARAEEFVREHAEEMELDKAINSTLRQISEIRKYTTALNSTEGAKMIPDSAERLRMMEEAKKMETEYVKWIRQAKAMYKL